MEKSEGHLQDAHNEPAEPQWRIEYVGLVDRLKEFQEVLTGYIACTYENQVFGSFHGQGLTQYPHGLVSVLLVL